jgi:hypothetical protein
MAVKILDNAGVGAGTAIYPTGAKGAYVPVQVKTAGQVNIEGRLDDAAEWETLAVFTGDGIDMVAVCPQMRGNVVSGTGNNAWIDVQTLNYT